MKEQYYQTRNKIPVYSYPNPSLHSFCIGLYVKAGVLYENKAQNGITHFLEHVLFRNLNEAMDNQLYPSLDRLGLDFNGCTYKELMQFKITGSPSHFKEAARFLIRLFEPLTLSASSVDLERKRIKAEIRENDDIHSLDFYADRLIWEDSPLSMPIAGIPSTLNHIYKKDLEAARRQIFSIGRIHFYLTGSVSDKDISYLCRLIEKVSFPVWKGNADNCTPIPASFGRREPSLFIKQARYYYVRISFDLSAGGGQNAALDYLYDLLFLGDSCLAYSKLSEEQGYIYSFDPCLEKYGNAGCLTLSFCVSGTHFLPAVRTALSIFVSLRQELPDLSRVRPTYTDNSLMLLDQPEQLNWIGGYENHILGVSDSSLADRKARYEAVTPKQVQILASRIFRKNNLSLAVKSAGRSVTSALLRKLIEESGL